MTHPFATLGIEAQRLPGALPAWHAPVAPGALRALAEKAKARQARLVALWASDETPRGAGYGLHVALALREGLLWIGVPLEREHPRYPGIADLFPAAARMQRAAYDLVGVHAQDSPDHRKWLRHAAWPGGQFPLRKDFDAGARFEASEDRYPFVRVEGEGVHEIPVGPVHAGTIEPGHFRFSIVGEKILKLEERLGYKHKGIEKRFEGMTALDAARLAGRVSGDSTVAYAWAYAMALEALLGVEVPPRAAALRGVALELERVANHLGDLGYLGNDVGLSFGFFQFWRLKEDLLRLNCELFGHRYLMDYVVPGGVAGDPGAAACVRLIDALAAIEREIGELRTIYDEHAGAQDRFIMTGQVTPELAAALDLTGLAGRASGQEHDLRAAHPIAPYRGLEVRVSGHIRGDVAARVSVRFEELAESFRLIRALADALPPGELRLALERPGAARRGCGWVEGWRGEVFIALETGAEGALHRVHVHDPSWQNWPLLERAVLGNIVPDFPLINKSFNLSYSGHDL
ncbi:MAG: dehydrogenase (ubiquinone) 30 kDa subunit [Burkholderiales bacterium]|jgi:Ni,Fe-hydrogenase III large subunit/Ni,Fe-hydrogenase III component G|nr:dehydrogenase (ubiquinone) 30 kDa subunit [Burkholderiales bacterium]